MANAQGGRILVVLPAYNEAPRLPALLERWQAVLSGRPGEHRIVVVDDGSRDGTAEAARAWQGTPPVELVAHEVNRGLGRTLADGFSHCMQLGQEGDLVVVMDADNTQPPELLPRMLEILASTGSDVVIASRFQPGARVIGVSAFRRFLSRGASVAFRLGKRVPGVRDYTCGYRLYRWEILQRAYAHHGERFIERDGFECQLDTLLKLWQLGARFAEAPLDLDYRPKLGNSQMKVGRTILRSLALLVSRS